MRMNGDFADWIFLGTPSTNHNINYIKKTHNIERGFAENCL